MVDIAEKLAIEFPFLAKRNWLLVIYLAKAQILSAKYSGKIHDNTGALNYLTKAKQMGFMDWAADEMESNIAFQEGDWEKAARLSRQAYEAIAREGWAQGVASLRRRRGEALTMLGQLEEAESELKQALAFFSAHHFTDFLSLTQLSLAKLYSIQGKYEEAWGLSENAIANAESLIGEFRELLSQQQFLIDKLEYYQQAFQVAIASERSVAVERAWSVAEQAKSFYLCQLLAASNVSLFEGISPEKIDHLKELESLLDECQIKLSVSGSKDLNRKQQLEAELASLSVERESYLSSLMLQNKRWASIRKPGRLQIKQVHDRLGPSWGLVSYFWTSKQDGSENLSILYTDKNNELTLKKTTWTPENLQQLDTYKKNLKGLPNNLADPVCSGSEGCRGG
jgi:tetratricopeptide (TPR) repeat protein